MINATADGLQPALHTLELSTQYLNPAGHISVVVPTTQEEWTPRPLTGFAAEVPITPIQIEPDLTAPRVPGGGKAIVLRVSSDFDAALDPEL